MRTGISWTIVVASFVAAGWLAGPASAQRTPARPGDSPGLNDGYGPGIADDVVVQYDPETGSLIVITDDETNKHIEQVIKALDRPVPQVLIRVLFLEVTHSGGLDLGVEFLARDTDTRTYLSSVNQNDGGSTAYETTTEVVRQDILETLFGVASEMTGAFYRLTKEDLEVTVRALADAAELEVLSRPSILTRNNQEAVITVGQEVPFIRNTRILQDGQQLNTVEYEDIGIILRVTPHIQPNGLVAMDVIPEISTLTGETVPISDTVSAPVFAKRSAETGVVVPHGETVVIGGLMEDQETKSVRKVPLLGDIPVLGHLFKRKIKSNAKTELLIFLTPYIVPDPSQLTGVTIAEKKDAQLAPAAFSEEQMKRYVGEWTPSAGAETAEQVPSAPAPGPDSTQREKPADGNKGVIYRGPEK